MANQPTIKIKLLCEHAKLPVRGSNNAIGMDLFACVWPNTGPIILGCGNRFMVPTGIAVAIPEGYYGRVAPRSGLAVKRGIDVMAGVIDSDYRGEIFVLLVNLDAKINFEIKHGMKIAQLILERADYPFIESVNELPGTERANSGFGSTGA